LHAGSSRRGAASCARPSERVVRDGEGPRPIRLFTMSIRLFTMPIRLFTMGRFPH
jgi:hypothetical protein